MKMRHGFMGVFCLLTAVSASAQKAPRYPIQQFKLNNGMRVVLSEDHSAPVVGLALAYDVGGRNEAKGRTGFAHLFEHLMFQGSANAKKGEFGNDIIGGGGIFNGFTRSEDTTYVEQFPAEKLPTILWLEADRMRSLAVTAENLKNQQEVVKEEKRLRYDNVPYAQARQRLTELAYSNFNNQHSVIGSMADLDAASLSDVQQFFKTYYAPNNATLVLTGDFDPKQAKQIIAQYFSDIPRQPEPPKPDVKEAPQTAEKREIVSDRLARLPALAIAWHSPALDSPDHYALELLGSIVFGGQTSRAYQEIVKKRQLAVSLNGGANTNRSTGLFTLFAVYPPNVDAADLEKAIYAQIDALAQTPPTEEELQRVKTSLRAGQYRSAGFRGLESMWGRAVEIADVTVFQNNPNLVNTEMNRYLAVTPAQIQAVARKYFAPANRTVLTIKPGGSAPTTTTARQSAGQTNNKVNNEITARGGRL